MILLFHLGSSQGLHLFSLCCIFQRRVLSDVDSIRYFVQNDAIVTASPIHAGAWEYFFVPLPDDMKQAPLFVEIGFPEAPSSEPHLFVSRSVSGIPKHHVDCLTFWGSGPYDEVHCAIVGYDADYKVCATLSEVYPRRCFRALFPVPSGLHTVADRVLICIWSQHRLSMFRSDQPRVVRVAN